jgi:hypothetical protein
MTYKEAYFLNMDTRITRWLLVTFSSAVLVALVLRRRETLMQTVPEFVEERIVLPMGDFFREGFAQRQPESTTSGERMTRKVGRNRKISVYGKLYGPIAADLVGQQVEVEERDNQLVVWSGTNEVGSFERQS